MKFRSQVYLLWIYLVCGFSVCHSQSEDPGTMYFGFVFDETTAKSIKTTTDGYLSSILQVPEYLDFLQKIAGIENILDYYVKPLDPNTKKYDPYYHVTLKYCGTDKEACQEYEKTNSQYIDQTFDIHLIGYILTNRTFGIRVNLTSAQLPLFENVKASYQKDSIIRKELKHQDNESFVPLEPFPPLLPASNSNAHITLGCGPGIPAVTTGHDLAKAIEFESENVTSLSFENIKDPFDPEKGNMLIKRYIKNGTDDPVFVIYPRVKLIANAKLLPYKNPSINSAESVTAFKLLHLVTFIVFSTHLLFK